MERACLHPRVRACLPRVEVCGVDLVSDMLAKGQPRWRLHRGHVLPVQGDSERLPFASGSFDIVTCANSFHHYPRQDRAVAEMRRVLRPGGRLMIIDGYRDAPWGWFIYDVCVAGVEGDVHHASAKRFRELMTQAGLKAVAQRVFRGPAPFLITEGDRRGTGSRRSGTPFSLALFRRRRSSNDSNDRHRSGFDEPPRDPLQPEIYPPGNVRYCADAIASDRTVATHRQQIG